MEFLKGYIEEIPLADGSVDVIISNCVINLSTDKPKVVAEMFRVLAPDGRLGISDVVAANELVPADRAERGSYVGCIAGALSFEEYAAGARRSGVHGHLDRTRPTSSSTRCTGRSCVRERCWFVTDGAVPQVLFVCVHNAGRSQMAAALLERYATGRVIVRSAGSTPANEINPAVVGAMREFGIDLSDRRAEDLTTDAVEGSDVVVTMGCGDACPVFPGKRYLDWELDDPAGRTLEEVRMIRDQIDERVKTLVRELLGASG